MWCMKRTNIYLGEGQAAALDRAARAAGVSRAELIRELIDRAIGSDPGSDLAADLAAIDGSFGILAGEDTFTRARTSAWITWTGWPRRDPGRQRRAHRAPARRYGRTGLARAGPAVLRAAGHQCREPDRDRRGDALA